MYHCWMGCQQVSGIEPPPPLITNMFDDGAVSGVEVEEVGTTLASEVRKATSIASSRRWDSRRGIGGGIRGKRYQHGNLVLYTQTVLIVSHSVRWYNLRLFVGCGT